MYLLVEYMPDQNRFNSFTSQFPPLGYLDTRKFTKRVDDCSQSYLASIAVISEVRLELREN